MLPDSDLEQYKSFFEHGISGYALHKLILDREGQPVDYLFLDVNQVFEEQTGFKRENILGKRATEVLPGIKKTDFIEIYGQVVKTGEARRIEKYYRPLKRWYDISVYPLSGLKFATNFVDINSRKRMEQELKEQKNLMEATLDGIPEALLMIAPDGTVKNLNKQATSLPGIKGREFVGQNLSRFFPEEEIFSRAVDKVLVTGGGVSFEITHQDSKSHYRCELNPVYSKQSKLQYLVVQMRDISTTLAREEKLSYITFHDRLSGLYNREYFLVEMERLDTERQLPISVIIADINGLKIINNSFGHQYGDKLIKEGGRVIENCCREEDIVARWGGDEFAVLLPRTPADVVTAKIECISQICSEIKVNNIPLTMAFGYATKTEVDQDLEDVIQQADDFMYKNKLVDRESIRGDMLNTLLKTLEVKSNETERHSLRMVQLALMFGERLNLSGDQLDKLSLIATLHDIGKIAISEDILKKPGRLNDEEWVQIQNHPEGGYNIVSSSEGFAHVAEDILSHHERWDGTGYPRQLQGEEIPLLSRIITIVDAYDVMTNGRPYKEPKSREEAIEELYRCAGEQFDPELVDIFVELID